MSQIIDWTNNNAGFLALVIFLFTLITGWLSGIFSKLAQVPSLKIKTLHEGTMCSVAPTGNLHHNIHPCYRFVCSLYLEFVNTGFRTIVFESYQLSYPTQSKEPGSTMLCIKNLTVCKSDFCVPLGGGDTKVLPFFEQKGYMTGISADTFIQSGFKTNGVLYFESDEYYGDFAPFQNPNKTVSVILHLKDTLGKEYEFNIDAKLVNVDIARKTCSKFGTTYNDLSKAGGYNYSAPQN
ncbi:hypothetical protein AVO42_02980 [Thiomicrospira sp. XS5]|uniref:hypothetical protein n=1 Tax=Thiomicrospira sp. XS5 TaxID=1775636 RepID=UPI000749D478|nr:hypothetical protein [Thiomicrospira sp. XS5]KUJ74389.1 hypothetical protein AVO42_02980 [Thiomicrospira sp. XS5]